MEDYLLLLYAAVSVISFFAYGVDKRRARRKKWRIPESLLLGLGVLGGAVGSLIGMNLFRHKTRHLYFWLINLLALAAQVALLILI